jgi:biopolymer transport protein ExbB
MIFWQHLSQWWLGGDVLMPVMLAVSLVLYGLLAERAVLLWGPALRRERRLLEIHQLVAAHPDRAWAAQYLALAEEAQLTRGFLLIRTLTLLLPLCGLLGTVSGMVDTFGALALPGLTTARQTSAGIGLALTATQYGMALAIPAMCGEWLLRQRVLQVTQQRDATACGAIASPVARPARIVARERFPQELQELACSA